MSRFLVRKYGGLQPYVPGEQPQNRKYIKLNTNESPYETSPLAVAAVTKAEVASLRLYSDPRCVKSTEAIAAYYGVKPQNVLVGNGSDELLAFVYFAFFDAIRGLAAPDVSYGFYPVFSELIGLKSTEIPLKEDFSVDLEAFIEFPGDVILANPNAQTGIALTAAEIERIIVANPQRLVVIDEAYVDFGAESVVGLTKKYDNLIVVQTFSKSRSLAGGRLGFCVACEELIADLCKIKFSFNPYNVNRLTDLVGKYAIEDVEWFEANRKRIAETREESVNALRALGFKVWDSKANFFLAESPKISGGELYRKLKERGILVRYFGTGRIANCVRITVGTKEDMQTLISEIQNIILGSPNV